MGAPLAALLAAVAAFHGAPATTHDQLYVFLGDRGPVYLDYFVRPAKPLAAILRAFRTPRRIEDLLPRALLEKAYWDELDGSASRLLLASGRFRLYGIPEPSGGLCFYQPDTRGYCVASLRHGAYPFVDARYGDVYGVLDDRAVRVDVRFRSGMRRAVLGHNAFYAHGSSARVVVVTDRDGARHVYAFTPCEVSEGAFLVLRPLDPLPSYCG